MDCSRLIVSQGTKRVPMIVSLSPWGLTAPAGISEFRHLELPIVLWSFQEPEAWGMSLGLADFNIWVGARNVI